MPAPALRTTVAVVPVGGVAAARGADLARSLAAEGAAVVLITDNGPDVASVGELASEIEAGSGRRPVVYTLAGEEAGSLDGLVELLRELFP